ncbi:MAG: leucine-rich repeat protein, partial [Clostridia bacterium]|nr:leucine-rich repeat protein [Clostridia bacterium]
ENLMLRFVFRKYMSSVFTAIPIEEFTSEDFVLGDYINYQVIYSSTGLPFEDKLYPLTTDMIDADCIGYLSQPGRHTIKVSIPRKEGKDPIHGSFTLNLSEPASNLEFVTLTFTLNEGTAYFGTTNQAEKNVSVEVQKGMECDWDEFEREFLVKRTGYVLDGLTPDKFGPRYEGDSARLEKIVFDQDKTYSFMWIENMIQVTFDLNKPTDAVLDTDKGITQKQINDEISAQSVEMYKGTVRRPDSNVVNSYLGYSFSGWYYNDPDEGNKEKLWLFTQTVGRKNVQLYGKWTPKYYDFQIFTMGGRLKSDLHDTITEEQIAEQNLVFATCDVKFDLSSEDGLDINDITFGELTYHKRHTDYVVKVPVSRDSEETVTIRLNEILTLLEKGGDIFKTNGIYRNAMHTPDSRFSPDGSTLVEKDEVCYLEWIMEDAVKNDPAKFSNYYINYAFKGDEGIVLKADGTLRINRLYDASMNELIVPATLLWPENNTQGYTERPITEIGDRALSNAKSLIKVDMSKASNLTTISTRAFCYCQNLTDVIFPTGNNIVEVGEDAFSRTAWQDSLFDEGEYGLIVIGTSIYKLAGDGIDELDTVDLNDAPLKDYLKDDVVYNIAPGCFAETTALERIMLANNIDYIHNLAFNGLTNLGAVITKSDSKLYYIGETAFNGCTKFMAGTDDYNIANGAIVIGNVLYRLLDKDATAYTVKSNVKNIAPSAFIGCTKLTSISFEDESKIETIGKDAFIDTPWAQTKEDGYTIVNGILANVHSQDFKNRNISLPMSVTSISEYAFGSYARYIETVELRQSVKSIDGFAFAGASSMRSFIFTDAAYDNAQNALVNIPTISGDSFANAKGTLLSGVKLYFSQAVYDFFATERCKETNPDWYEFFRLYPSAFAVEQIQGVWVNPAVVPSAFINNGVDIPFANSYENGLVIMSSSGVTKYDTLDKNENAVSFATSEGEHILRFTYKGEDKYCHNEDKDAHVFKYNIRNAISGAPEIGSTIDASGKTDADSFWIETYQGKSATGQELWARAFLGDVDGATVPTFYTSHSTLDLANYRFAYKDAFYDTTKSFDDNEKENHVQYLPFTQATGYAPTVNKNSHITFTVDFWGIGIYSVAASYSGAKSRYVEVVQKESISIPLNGSESVYVRNSYVYLRGQDGREQKILFTLNTFKLVAVDGEAVETLPTNKLGMHKMKVSYTSDDALNVETGTSTIFANIMYSVVLEADNSVFKFEILNQRDMTAKITACTNNTADTLVIPDKY